MTRALKHRISTNYLPEFRAWGFVAMSASKGCHPAGTPALLNECTERGRRPQQDEAPTRLRLLGRRTF